MIKAILLDRGTFVNYILLAMLCLAVILVCLYILQAGDIIQKIFLISANKAKTQNLAQSQQVRPSRVYSAVDLSQMETRALADGFALSQNIVYIPMDSFQPAAALLVVSGSGLK